MIPFLHPRLRTLSRFIDGSLTGLQAAKLAAHVDGCPRCQARIRPLRAMQPAFTTPAGDPASRQSRILAALSTISRVESPAVGRVCAVIGVVLIERPGRDGAPATALPGLTLMRGDRIRAADHSLALLKLADGSHFYISKNTELEMETAQGDAGLRAGELLALMKPQPRPFIIKTPSAALAVLGTDFDTSVTSDGRTFLAVLKGRVAFENQAGKVIVGRGKQVIAKSQARPQPEPLANARSLTEWASALSPGSVSRSVKGIPSMKGMLISFAIAIGALLGGWGLYMKHVRPPRVVAVPVALTPAQSEEAQAIRTHLFTAPVLDSAWKVRDDASRKANARRIRENFQIYAIAPDHSVYLGILDSVENNSNAPISGEMLRGGTGSDTVDYFDEQGLPLPVTIRHSGGPSSKAPGQIWVTFQNPIPPHSSRQCLYLVKWRAGLKQTKPGEYELRMGNLFGDAVLETFALALPAGWSIVSSSRPPTRTDEPAGGPKILYWQDQVPKNARHSVEVTLKEGAAH